jgi:hypothetical protein
MQRGKMQEQYLFVIGQNITRVSQWAVLHCGPHPSLTAHMFQDTCRLRIQEDDRTLLTD